GICALLGIGTTLSWSTDYDVEGARTDRLVALCRAAGATEYVSGPRARSYLDEEQFSAAGIKLVYFDYDGYPKHAQPHPPVAPPRRSPTPSRSSTCSSAPGRTPVAT